MTDAKKLLKNTVFLTLGTAVMRLCALCFQAYLAKKAGAETLGVYGVTASVGAVFATVAISGVRFGVTRLASEEMSCGNDYPCRLMCCAFSYAAFFGIGSGLAMYFSAEALSGYWIMNSSAADALRIMSLSMPAISLGAAVQGYYTAGQKVLRLVITEFCTQLLRMGYVAACFAKAPDVSAVTVLSRGMLLGESLLSGFLLIIYMCDTTGKKERKPSSGNLRRLTKTALPLAVSAYMRTGLSSLGQVIIPRGLKSSGMGSKSAFSTYGIISQMSMPVIMFPAVLLNSLGEILVPRLTGAQVTGRKIGISYIVNRALRIGVLFSFCVSGVMLFFSGRLGECIYNSMEAGLYISIFAPLVPIVYIDCVTDGCLKGLNQQVYSMMYNVWEGVLNVALLFFLLPRYGIMGYIFVSYTKEVFNAVLSIKRLSRITSVDFRSIGVSSALLAVVASGAMCRFAFPSAPLFPAIIMYCLLYTAILYIISAVSRDDIRWLVSLVRNENEISQKNILPVVIQLMGDK